MGRKDDIIFMVGQIPRKVLTTEQSKYEFYFFILLHAKAQKFIHIYLEKENEKENLNNNLCTFIK